MCLSSVCTIGSIKICNRPGWNIKVNSTDAGFNKLCSGLRGTQVYWSESWSSGKKDYKMLCRLRQIAFVFLFHWKYDTVYLISQSGTTTDEYLSKLDQALTVCDCSSFLQRICLVTNDCQVPLPHFIINHSDEFIGCCWCIWSWIDNLQCWNWYFGWWSTGKVEGKALNLWNTFFSWGGQCREFLI